MLLPLPILGSGVPLWIHLVLEGERDPVEPLPLLGLTLVLDPCLDSLPSHRLSAAPPLSLPLGNFTVPAGRDALPFAVSDAISG